MSFFGETSCIWMVRKLVPHTLQFSVMVVRYSPWFATEEAEIVADTAFFPYV